MASTAVHAAGGAGLVMRAPGQAQVGDLVPVTVGISEALPSLAAFEVVATFDPSAAVVEAADTRSPDGKRTPLSIPDMAGRAVLAAYTPAAATPAAASTDLGVMYVRVTKPGRIEIAAGSPVLADAAGVRMPIDGTASIVIDVLDDAGSATETLAAPGMPWALADTGNGISAWPTLADARVEWQTSRLSSSPCAAPSAALAGGCVDIADVQAMSTAEVQRPAATGGPTLAGGGTYTVNSTADTVDAVPGNGACLTAGNVCSLRAAVTEANLDQGPSTIRFALPGDGPFTIQLNDQLPALTDSGTTIDGYTQAGATPNTDAIADNAVLKVAIRGKGVLQNAFDALAVQSDGNTIRGLSIYDVRRPIWIDNAAGNVVQGNFIGTDPAGDFTTMNDDDNGHGIHIEHDSPGTIIGGTQLAQRNVISGNARTGIGIWDVGSDNTVIQGNIIGLNPSGTAALPNRKHGVDFNFGVSSTVLGGTAAGQRNVISGNVNPDGSGSGVEISHTAETTGNQVVGNLIGTDLTGVAAPAFASNGDAGVYIEDGASGNVVADNVIVNNGKGGVRILNGFSHVISTGNVVRNNRIGVLANGAPAGNGQLGVSVDGAGSRIEANIIANNQGAGIISGILYYQATSNTFSKNSIVDNVGLPIDLAPNGVRGVTPNDPFDLDTGPNGLVNFPVLTAATTNGAAGTTCANCVVELFLTGDPLANGHGPLRIFVASITANAQGVFAGSYPDVPLGGQMTATATDPNGSTSEASANAVVTQGSSNGEAPPPPPPPPDAVGAPIPGPGGTLTDYVTMAPVRLLDSRIGPSAMTIDGAFQGIGMSGVGTVVELQVTGRGSIPAETAAVVLNITATEAVAAGYVTAYPCGTPAPLASNLNFTTGSTNANLVIAKVGDGGKVCILTSNPTHLIADVNGFFPVGSSYATMSPVRLLDSRTDPAALTFDGAYQGIGMSGVGTVVELQVTDRAEVPADASAVALNITATEAAAAGYITAYPCGTPAPLASNVNFTTASTTPNLVIAKVGDGGKVCILTSNPTHLIADLNGYFPAVTSYATMSPVRLLDSRSDPAALTFDGQYQGIGMSGVGTVVDLQVTGRAGVPPSAHAVALNITATEGAVAGYVTAYPCGTPAPLASNLNFTAGSTNSNLVIAKVGDGGKVCILTSNPTHLVADVNGYFP